MVTETVRRIDYAFIIFKVTIEILDCQACGTQVWELTGFSLALALMIVHKASYLKPYTNGTQDPGSKCVWEGPVAVTSLWFLIKTLDLVNCVQLVTGVDIFFLLFKEKVL